jgi:hypothetical protein
MDSEVRSRPMNTLSVPPERDRTQATGGRSIWSLGTILKSGLVPLALGLTSALLFLPFQPVMPRVGLDPSWLLAVNEAVARGLVFGRDVIYTVGPLASIWNQTYHPATFVPCLVGGGLIAIGHTFTAHKVSQHAHSVWGWAYVAFLGFVLESRDALFLAYPLLLALLIYRLSLPSWHEDRARLSTPESVWLAVAVSALGLLPIIKLSFLPLTLLLCALGAILLWKSGQKPIAIALIVLPVIAMTFFWTLVGGPVSALPSYFISSTSIVSGFTLAMSTRYFLLTPVMFLLTSLLALFCFCRARERMDFRDGAFLLFIAAFLFMAFKSGFVRHDVHALTASSSLVMVAVVLDSLRTMRQSHLRILFLGALVTWSLVHLLHLNPPYEYYRSLGTRVHASRKGQATGETTQLSLEETYSSSLAEIRRAIPLPSLEGTTDLYPFELSALVASGNEWSPRPVFQSFSAYTPALATLNRDHLSSSRAPDNILFDLITIDRRYPSMDDGSSWPTLMTWYDLSGATDRYLLLQRRAPPLAPPTTSLVFSTEARLGEEVSTGLRDGIAYAAIDVRPSLLGRIAGFLYKPTLLSITVTLSDGSTRQHRFVPGQAVSGFVLSPYVSDRDGFADLLRDRGSHALPLVSRFKIEEAPIGWAMWKSDYSISLYRLDVEGTNPQ